MYNVYQYNKFKALELGIWISQLSVAAPHEEGTMAHICHPNSWEVKVQGHS